jgi:hypothetical protein
VNAATRSGPVAQQRLGALDAMAKLARQMGSVVHVVVPRVPGAVAHARQAAEAARVRVSIDLMAVSLHARFDGRGEV